MRRRDALNGKVNLTHAGQFMAAMVGMGPATYQTFCDNGGDRSLARILHGAFESVSSELATLNSRGAGVFFCVNETDLKGRSAANVVKVRAVFVDGDDLEMPEKWHVPPHVVVKRDARHWHAYWLVEGAPLDQFGGAQKRLAAYYGTDAAIHDLPRVMRIPGFLHRKADPILVKAKRVYDGAPRTLDEITASLPLADAERAKLRDTERKGVIPSDSRAWIKWPSDAWSEKVRRDEVHSILLAHGWKESDKVDPFWHYTRPGKESGVSAGLDPQGWLRVFTNNAHPFRPGEWHSPYFVFSELVCGGDHKKAHEILRDDGYGERRKDDAPEPEKPLPQVGAPKKLQLPEYMSQVQRGDIKVVDMPWGALTKYSRALAPQTITVLVGLRGKGKSFLVLQLAIHLHRTGVPYAALELESTQRFYEQRLLAMLAGNSNIALEEYWTQNPETVKEARAKHEADLLKIIQSIDVQPEDDSTSGVLAWMRAQAMAGKRVLMIDPISAREGSRDPWLDDKRFMKGAREVANDYMCSIVFVTHLKTTRGRDMKQVYAQDGYETEGGKKIEDACDTLLMLLSVKPEEVMCVGSFGREEHVVNQHIWLKKTRIAKTCGRRIIGLYHDPDTAMHIERGFIVREDEK